MHLVSHGGNIYNISTMCPGKWITGLFWILSVGFAAGIVPLFMDNDTTGMILFLPALNGSSAGAETNQPGVSGHGTRATGVLKQPLPG